MATSAAVKRATQDQTVSEAVVAAVAEFTGSEPTSLDPLYNTVDPDALDALFDGDQTGRSPDRVAFTYCDCDVTVTTTGAVQVSKSGLSSPESPSKVTENARS